MSRGKEKKCMKQDKKLKLRRQESNQLPIPTLDSVPSVPEGIEKECANSTCAMYDMFEDPPSPRPHPRDQGYLHWLVQNGRTRISYCPPNPPPGHRMHHYTFALLDHPSPDLQNALDEFVSANGKCGMVPLRILSNILAQTSRRTEFYKSA